MQEYFAKGRLGRLCLKELRESLRDRRTIITLIMMPILVYPLLSMAMQRLILSNVRVGTDKKAYVLGAADEATANIVAMALRETQNAIAEGVRPSIEIIRTNAPPSAPSAAGSPASSPTPLVPDDQAAFNLVVSEGASLGDVLRDGTIDIAIRSGKTQAQTWDQRGAFTAYAFDVQFRDGDPRSEAAMLEFRKAMQTINDYQSAILRGPQVPAAVQMAATAVGQKFDPLASLAGVLPLVLILMTITGAVYPAIDLTAGERERGTMEAMIASPAPRFVLLLSKYVAVVTVAVLTALANLFASWVTLSIGGLGRALLGDRGFSFWALLQILPLLVIFAAFFSAILLAMCSFARSFKEAQAYLIPVMLVSLAPALVTLMPNIEFSTLLGVVPLVNILLLSRDIMTGSPAALPAFAAVFSTLIYAAAALVVASRLFGAESATAGSQESWSDLIRRPRKARSLPDLGELAIYLALLFPLFFVATNLAGQQAVGIAGRLWTNAGLLVVLFLIAPAIYAWYRKLVIPDTFLLNFGAATCSKHGIGGAVRWIGCLVSAAMLGLGLWVVAFEILKSLSDWGFGELGLERSQALEELTRSFREIPLWVILLTSAAIPAISEEFFFRGFVLSAFRGRVSTVRAILYSALIFGVFHVISGSMLSIERFAPTLLLGIVLGWMAIRTKSLWPGILTHAIHNGLLFWLTRFDTQQLATWFGGQSEHFPWPWIVASLMVVAVGCITLMASTSGSSHESTS